MSEEKKNFFKRPSAAEILRSTDNKEIKTEFWENITELKENESLTLIGKLFPYKFEGPDHFLKSGPLITVPTKEEHNPTLKPYEIREKVFDSLPKYRLRYAGFTFNPHFGVDRTSRVIRLNDILEAAKMYAYAPLSEEQVPFQASIQLLEIYDSVEGVAEKGASIITKVPSRTKGKGKYTLRLDHVPVADTVEKFNIAYMLKTDHVCEDKRHDIKFPAKSRPEFISEYRMDAHEIVAYFAIIDHYISLARKEKQRTGVLPQIIPIQMNLTGIPTPALCKNYDNLLHRVLLKETPDSNLTTLKEGHIEALLWEGMIKEGYKKCFFNDTGEKIKDFKWTKYK